MKGRLLGENFQFFSGQNYSLKPKFLIVDGQFFKIDFAPHTQIEILIRFVEDLKRPVLEVLEECIWDENSQLFQLRGFWNSGVKVKSRILEELEAYWTRLALQGRSLEEAAR